MIVTARRRQPEPLQVAAERAVDYLEGLAGQHGEFRDYALPVGASDEWVSAYVGLSLSEARRAGLRAAAHPAARAASWLRWMRHYDVGYGFNARTGPDADSTAHAVCLLRAEGHPVGADDLAWLGAQWRPKTGFATFPRDDGWGHAHGCVTPVVADAIQAAHDPTWRASLLDVLERASTGAGFRGYWWRSDHYATWTSLRWLRSAGADEPLARLARTIERTSCFHSALDLACIAGRELILRADPAVHAALLAALCSHQRDDGSWPPGPDLRVTSPAQLPGVGELQGEFYVDQRSTITTATCLRVLCDPAAVDLW